MNFIFYMIGCGEQDSSDEKIHYETTQSDNCHDFDFVGDFIDENCDGHDGVDEDKDGFASTSSGGEDCDDLADDIHPEASEICDEIDNMLFTEYSDGYSDGYDDGLESGLAQCTGSPEYCGEGTVWSEDFQLCVEDGSCPGDLDGDGIVGTNDLLLVLMDYGFACN